MKRRASPLLVFFILCLAMTGPAVARQGMPPPSASAATGPLAAVDQLAVPALVDPAALAKRAVAEPGPVQVAEPFAVDCSPLTHGTWDVLADGSRLWRLRIDAPGATDLNFGFGYFDLPEGARLYIVSEDYDYFDGPYSAADVREHHQLWTPIVPGSRAVIELVLPADAVGEPELWLSSVNRGFTDPFRLSKSKLEQQSCHNDVVCPVADPWRNETRSVARYMIGGAFLCTGTLIADVPRSFRSFFLTANHCGVNSVNGASVVVYWNYESPSCGQLGGGSLAQNQTGATLLASKRDVDFALLELSAIPDPAFNVYYAGWDRSGGAVGSAVGIHHPAGDEKAISFTFDALTTVDSCISLISNNTHWQVNGWDSGSTESGSSGSGLWNAANHLLVGTLSGGESSCFAPQMPDCYGKFSVAWSLGSSASSRLSDWLDPQGTGAMTVAGSDPPALVAPTLTFPVGGESLAAGSVVNVTWQNNGAPATAVAALEMRTCLAPQTWVEVGHAPPGVTSMAWRLPRLPCNGYQVRLKLQANAADDSDYDTSGTFDVTAGTSDGVGDFDNDGRWDLAVYETLTGNWFVQRSTDGFLSQQFGYAGTVPVPADYDGDGQTDVAVYELATGNWFILGSSAGFRTQNFGYSATLPVPGDYDGDGQADLAVFEPPTGTWYILGSASGFTAQNWGYSGVVPVPADYDADRKVDIAVYEPPTGTWYILGSASGFTQVTLGDASTLPVPGDYDADGKADVAVYQPASGNWLIRESRDGSVRGQNFGYSLAEPVPCDYDGDSLCDVAVFDTPSGNWFRLETTFGFRSQNWGYSATPPALLQHLVNRLYGF